MENLETLKRVNASLHKLNEALMRDYSITVAENLELKEKLALEISNKDYWINQDKWNRKQLERLKSIIEGFKQAIEYVDSIIVEKNADIEILRERNTELEQMLGAISLQCERELNKRDIELERLNAQSRENAIHYRNMRYSFDEFINNRNIELKLLVSIIKGEI